MPDPLQVPGFNCCLPVQRNNRNTSCWKRSVPADEAARHRHPEGPPQHLLARGTAAGTTGVWQPCGISRESAAEIDIQQQQHWHTAARIHYTSFLLSASLLMAHNSEQLDRPLSPARTPNMQSTEHVQGHAAKTPARLKRHILQGPSVAHGHHPTMFEFLSEKGCRE